MRRLSQVRMYRPLHPQQKLLQRALVQVGREQEAQEQGLGMAFPAVLTDLLVYEID
jgi:hypothetical protein